MMREGKSSRSLMKWVFSAMSAGCVPARDFWINGSLAMLLCLREAIVQSGSGDSGDVSSALAKDGSISDVARISGTVEGGGVNGIVETTL